MKKKFNVILFNWNKKTIEPYDVLPYFRNEWKSKNELFEKDKVKDKKTLKKWIKETAKYMYWARCEYEFLIAPWPYKTDTLLEDMIKIDAYEQISYNIDIITDILYEEFKIKEN